jgi:SET domain-containing protein
MIGSINNGASWTETHSFTFFDFGFLISFMIDSSLYIASTENMGRGVFTSENIEEGTTIETSPVIVMSRDERKLLDQTLLHDYIFEWGEKKDQCCMAMGYVPIYNHSYKSNCEYEMDFANQSISIKTVRFIKAGEELFINYNGDWNDSKKVWFDASQP